MKTTQNRLAGYAFLIEQYGLSALPNWHISSVSPTGTLRSTVRYGRVESVYLQSYLPGSGTGDHLEFALKIVDMPDRLIDLFIQFCLQNNGRLSARKRESHFGLLTDDELAGMENAVRKGFSRD